MRSCHSLAVRNRGQRLTPALCGLLAIFIATPLAAEDRIRIGGSEVAITAGNGFQQLRFKNQPIAEGETIRLVGQLADEGREALLFEVKPGSGSCRPGVVALTARPGEEPRFDRRLIDECGGFEIARAERSILLVSPAAPAGTGSLWRLSAKDGLVLEATLGFTPQPGTGFADLKPGLTAAAMLRNQAVWAAFTALSGAELKRNAALLAVAGPAVEAQPPFVAATGCGGDCRNGAALMLADPERRALYLAIRLKGEKLRTLPDLARWPAEAKATLGRWTQRLDAPDAR